MEFAKMLVTCSNAEELLMCCQRLKIVRFCQCIGHKMTNLQQMSTNAHMLAIIPEEIPMQRYGSQSCLQLP